MPADRRTTERFLPESPVPVRLKTALPARLLDVSMRGAQIEVGAALKLHVVCDLRISIEGREVTFRGIVRRCRVAGMSADEPRALLYRAGIEFDPLDRSSETALASLLERCEPQSLLRAVDGLGKAPLPMPASPRVKIRIQSEYVRRVLDAG